MRGFVVLIFALLLCCPHQAMAQEGSHVEDLGGESGYLRGHRTLLDILAFKKWGDFNFTWMEREYIYLHSNPKTSTPHFLFNFIRAEYVPENSVVQPYVFGVLVNTYYSFNEIWTQAVAISV